MGSKKFLNGRVLCAESKKSAYRFELASEHCSGMVFKILPKFKLR